MLARSRIRIAKIGQKRLDIRRNKPHSLDGFVSRGVPDDRQAKPLSARLPKRLEDMGGVMRRRHKVDVQSPFSLKLEKNPRQARDGDIRSCTTIGNAGVLAIDAMQRTIREEHGSTARLARYRRLFPEMKRRTRDAQLVRRAAHSVPPRSPVGSAATGTQFAARQKIFEHVFLHYDRNAACTKSVGRAELRRPTTSKRTLDSLHLARDAVGDRQVLSTIFAPEDDGDHARADMATDDRTDFAVHE